MSIAGLRKHSNFQSLLDAVTKDEAYKGGYIAPAIQDYAKRIINSPDFQRVKDTLEDDLAQQTKKNLRNETTCCKEHVAFRISWSLPCAQTRREGATA